jgi:hypothetical protein
VVAFTVRLALTSQPHTDLGMLLTVSQPAPAEHRRASRHNARRRSLLWVEEPPPAKARRGKARQGTQPHLPTPPLAYRPHLSMSAAIGLLTRYRASQACNAHALKPCIAWSCPSSGECGPYPYLGTAPLPSIPAPAINLALLQPLALACIPGAPDQPGG